MFFSLARPQPLDGQKWVDWAMDDLAAHAHLAGSFPLLLGMFLVLALVPAPLFPVDVRGLLQALFHPVM